MNPLLAGPPEAEPKGPSTDRVRRQRCWRTGAQAAALAVLTAGALAGQAAPQATVLEPIHDFGAVRKGEERTTEFTIRNEGDRALEIREVRPTCGCTVVEHDREIAPGGEGRVRVRLDSTTLQGPAASRLLVYTNDPANPELVLTVRSDVRSPVAAVPGYVRFAAVEGADTATVVGQTLYAADGGELGVRDVISPYTFVSASVREASAEERQGNGDGRQWRVEVALSPSAPVGPLSGFLRVLVEHPQQSEVAIPVSGYVRPVVGLQPEMVDFGEVTLDSAVTRSVAIRCYGESVELGDVTSDVAGLETKVGTAESGRLFTLTLTLRPGMAKGDFAGTVQIRTTSSKRPTLALPVRGRVR